MDSCHKSTELRGKLAYKIRERRFGKLECTSLPCMRNIRVSRWEVGIPDEPSGGYSRKI